MMYRLFLVSFWLFIGVMNAVGQVPEFERISDDRLLAPVPSDRAIEVVDGDTIWIGIHQIRLYGIDAYEPKQPCSVAGQNKTYCHLAASAVLADFVARDDFRCEIHVKDGEGKPWLRYGRYIASCYAGDVDVSLALVRQGWAYADNNYGERFEAAQAAAAEARLGIFATDDPRAPWEWRKEQRGDYPTPCE